MISVVIPSYNRRAGMLALLRDLDRQCGVKYEVIVVDDCSSDGSADAIASEFPAVKLLRNLENGGPCVARNRGARAAQGEIIVGLDSDVSVPDYTLLQAVEKRFQDAPDISGLAFRVLSPDGLTDDVGRWWHPAPVARYAEQSFETSYFSGTAYAFRKSEMVAAGLFPEILYMHYEEVLLAFRVMDLGGKIIYDPALRVIHHVSPVPRRTQIQRFYKPRNQILLSLIAYPPFRAIRFMLPRLVWNFWNAALQWELHHLARAIVSALRLAPACFAERRPLRRRTWRRIKELGSGSIVPHSS